jgi:hypothetical protein
MAGKKTTKKSASKRSKRVGEPSKAGGLSAIVKNILRAKGVGEATLARLEAAGLGTREDFRVVGDAGTLAELTGLEAGVARRVMAWALGSLAGTGGTVVVESPDMVSCVRCGARQPKDYKSGDLCVQCGKQAEPVFACYWCSASGPGRFCRACGAVFVSPGELELAILLKRDGLPKDEIPRRLQSLSPAEKEVLWGRVHKR